MEYPVHQAASTSLHLMKQKLLVAIRALSIKKVSPKSINLVMAKCLYARGAYVGMIPSSWSLRDCEEIDTIFAAELRRRSKNLRTSQTENLYPPVREGGLGFQRFSSMVQQRKRNCVRRLLAHGDQWTQFAVQALCARGHPSPYHSSVSSLPPSLSDRGTGCPPFSRMDFRVTLASLSLSDRKRMLLSLSCLTLSPVVSHPVSTAPKLNTLTFGTATSSPMRM